MEEHCSRDVNGTSTGANRQQVVPARRLRSNAAQGGPEQERWNFRAANTAFNAWLSVSMADEIAENRRRRRVAIFKERQRELTVLGERHRIKKQKAWLRATFLNAKATREDLPGACKVKMRLGSMHHSAVSTEEKASVQEASTRDQIDEEIRFRLLGGKIAGKMQGQRPMTPVVRSNQASKELLPDAATLAYSSPLSSRRVGYGEFLSVKPSCLGGGATPSLHGDQNTPDVKPKSQVIGEVSCGQEEMKAPGQMEISGRDAASDKKKGMDQEEMEKEGMEQEEKEKEETEREKEERTPLLKSYKEQAASESDTEEELSPLEKMRLELDKRGCDAHHRAEDVAVGPTRRNLSLASSPDFSNGKKQTNPLGDNQSIENVVGDPTQQEKSQMALGNWNVKDMKFKYSSRTPGNSPNPTPAPFARKSANSAKKATQEETIQKANSKKISKSPIRSSASSNEAEDDIVPTPKGQEARNWLQELSPAARLFVCSITCTDFTQLIYRMWVELCTKPHGVFILESNTQTPKQPAKRKGKNSSTSNAAAAAAPTDFSFVESAMQRVSGLADERLIGETTLLERIRLGASKDGRGLDTVSLSAATACDFWELYNVMVKATKNSFLSKEPLKGSETSSGISLCTPWFQELIRKKEVTVGTMIANRIEIAIWQGFGNAKGGGDETVSPIGDSQRMLSLWMKQTPQHRFESFVEPHIIVEHILDEINIEMEKTKTPKHKESIIYKQVMKALKIPEASKTKSAAETAMETSVKSANDPVIMKLKAQVSSLKDHYIAEKKAYKAATVSKKKSEEQLKIMDATLTTFGDAAESLFTKTRDLVHMEANVADPEIFIQRMEEKMLQELRAKSRAFLLLHITKSMRRLSGLDIERKASCQELDPQQLHEDVFYSRSRLPTTAVNPMYFASIDKKYSRVLPFNGQLLPGSEFWTGYTGFATRAMKQQVQEACAKFAEADLLSDLTGEGRKAEKKAKSRKKNGKKNGPTLAQDSEKKQELKARAEILQCFFSSLVKRCQWMLPCRRLIAKCRQTHQIVMRSLVRSSLQIFRAGAQEKKKKAPSAKNYQTGSKQWIKQRVQKHLIKFYAGCIVLARQILVEAFQQWYSVPPLHLVFKKWRARLRAVKIRQRLRQDESEHEKGKVAMANVMFEGTSPLHALHMRLHHTIAAVAQEAAENVQDNFVAHAWAITAILGAVQQVWPGAKVHMYGSRATGLPLPDSDLDIAVEIPTKRGKQSGQKPETKNGDSGVFKAEAKKWPYLPRECVATLGNLLKKESWVDAVESITTTAIPVIRACATSPASAGGIQVPLDISFVASDHRGDLAVMVVRELMKVYPILKPLVIYMKGLLKKHELGNAYTGGMSPYATVILVAYFLGRSAIHENLGHAYLSFLHFVGHIFDPKQESVQIDVPLECLGTTPQESITQHTGMLHIIDPTCTTNNVGRTAFRFHEVQQVCTLALFHLTQPLRPMMSK